MEVNIQYHGFQTEEERLTRDNAVMIPDARKFVSCGACPTFPDSFSCLSRMVFIREQHKGQSSARN